MNDVIRNKVLNLLARIEGTPPISALTAEIREMAADLFKDIEADRKATALAKSGLMTSHIQLDPEQLELVADKSLTKFVQWFTRKTLSQPLMPLPGFVFQVKDNASKNPGDNVYGFSHTMKLEELLQLTPVVVINDESLEFLRSQYMEE